MPNILVVDDAAVDRQLVGGLLQRHAECTVHYAANGVEALARMKEVSPDLIVTDLTMPVMDGLELVRALRTHYPDVPVILMTAYGSEALAIEALDCGAASYVPKSRLAEKLVDTVEGVLALARAQRSREQLLRCLQRCELAFCLDNEPPLVDALVTLVQRTVEGMGFCDLTGRLRIGLALKEALLNAMFHGNLEISQEELEQVQDRLIQEEDQSLVEQRRSEPSYRDRRIHVEVSLSESEIRLLVRDDGKGFDTSTVPKRADPAALAAEHGRGLALIRAFMDEVRYNAAGNEVTLVKRREPG